MDDACCCQFDMHTEFQLYASNDDITERRLIKRALSMKDPQRKLLLMALIEDYRNGLIAVAWRHGAPVMLRVVKCN